MNPATLGPVTIASNKFTELCYSLAESGNLSLVIQRTHALTAHIDAAMAQDGQERYEAGKAESDHWKDRYNSVIDKYNDAANRAEAAEASLARLVEGVDRLKVDVPEHLKATPNGNHYRDGYKDALHDVRQGVRPLLPAKAEAVQQEINAALNRADDEDAARFPAPAMGEELPPLPESDHSRGDGIPGGPYHFYTADQMHDYGRACMALRQPGAEKASHWMDAKYSPREITNTPPEPFILGNQYRTQGGRLVRFVGIANEGNSYETMCDELGHHRYTRRDFGRGTGAPWNDDCVPPLYTHPAITATAPVSQPAAQEPPACRNQGGICACRSGGSYGGCALERGITHQSTAPQPITAPAGSEQENKDA